MNYIKIGLFFIKVSTGAVCYKFKILKNAKVYLILYILDIRISQQKNTNIRDILLLDIR